MIRRLITTVLVAGFGLALWQMSGGTQETFFATVWGAFYMMISFVADLITIAWNTVFSIS